MMANEIFVFFPCDTLNVLYYFIGFNIIMTLKIVKRKIN